MLVVIEGADGVGKDTVADAVAAGLGWQRLNFPNDGAVTGPLIRQYLRKQWWVERVAAAHDAQAGALEFQALQIVNRLESQALLEEAAKPKLRTGNLIAVRYWQRGWVYGKLDGLDVGFLERSASFFPYPTLSILLDAPADVCMERCRTRPSGKHLERYEMRLEAMRRTVDLYRQLWATRATCAAWPCVDANRESRAVVADVLDLVTRTHRCL
jgi:thymidylate kinase